MPTQTTTLKTAYLCKQAENCLPVHQKATDFSAFSYYYKEKIALRILPASQSIIRVPPKDLIIKQLSFACITIFVDAILSNFQKVKALIIK
jgi:hypothetical protein